MKYFLSECSVNRAQWLFTVRFRVFVLVMSSTKIISCPSLKWISAACLGAVSGVTVYHIINKTRKFHDDNDHEKWYVPIKLQHREIALLNYS